MKIATARVKTSKRWRTQEITWEQFLQKLNSPMRTAETAREYKAMSKAERDLAKGAAGGFVGGSISGGQRKTENVTARYMLTLDADNAKPGAWERVTLLHDFRMAVYSTHSHTAEKPRLRWIVPTDRAMTPDEYPAVARKVAEWLDIETMDPSTYEIARLMYWPTCSKDGEYLYRTQDGPVLRVDDVLAKYGCYDAWKDTTLWPIAKSEQEIRLRSMSEAGDPLEKPGIVGLFCRTYDVHDAIAEFLPEVYLETTQADRYTFAGGSTAAGAIVYNDGRFLYSNHSTDPCAGHSVNAFDMVRIHKFGDLDADTGEDTTVTKLESYKAMCRFAAGLAGVKQQMAEEKSAQFSDEFGDLLNTDSEQDDAPANWEAMLELHPKTGECEPSINNALLILLNDPAIKDSYGYDLFAEKPKLRGDVPWRPKGMVKTTGRGTNWADQDEAGLRWYLQHKWKFKSENDLKNALEMAMRQKSFHPVRDYLNSLVWDGEERLDTVAVRHMGAEDTELHRKLIRKWFVGAVKRIMIPGCKVDAALVFVGPQYLGKSGFADVVSKGWFNDSEVDMTSKEGYQSLHGSWIIELAELASVKRADLESVKTFITKREDTYRAPYGKHTDTYPRQCVFFGSTNEFEFLRDRTGNRRFWPVDVSRFIDRDALEREVDQLWAEAMYRWRQGEQSWLTPEEDAELAEYSKPHVVQDELESQLMCYLDTLLPENWYDLSPETRRDLLNGDVPCVDPSAGTMRRNMVCLTEIRIEMCGEDRRRSGGSDLLSRRLANIMNTSRDWQKSRSKRHVPGYGAQWVYIRKGTETAAKTLSS